MEEDKMKDLMIDYLEGNLTGELKEFVARHIEKEDRWKKEFEELKFLFGTMENSSEVMPEASLKRDFEEMLQKEISMQSTEEPQESKQVFITPRFWMQVAASITILAVGVIFGINITQNNNERELAALKAEMEQTKQMVMTSLQNQSASSRLNAVNVTYTMPQYDHEIIEALVNTLNNDENANVRLAAMEALSQFEDNPEVREALIASLSTQDKPVVQIALINLMVKLNEKRAITPMKQMMDNDMTLQTVKDEANFGVYKLS